MAYPLREQGNCVTVVLDGEVDLAASPAAREAILEAVSRGRHVIVDLSTVEYMDSSGVACLVEGYQVARKKGRRLVLAGAGQAVMNVLALARLDRVFPLFPDTAAAARDCGA